MDSSDHQGMGSQMRLVYPKKEVSKRYASSANQTQKVAPKTTMAAE